jgi:hypothetical protein
VLVAYPLTGSIDTQRVGGKGPQRKRPLPLGKWNGRGHAEERRRTLGHPDLVDLNSNVAEGRGKRSQPQSTKYVRTVGGAGPRSQKNQKRKAISTRPNTLDYA